MQSACLVAENCAQKYLHTICIAEKSLQLKMMDGLDVKNILLPNWQRFARISCTKKKL